MFRTPKIFQAVYPSLVWEKPTKENTIYLTFDDGPVPEATPFVLDELKKYNAKATFFCIGDNIKKHPEIYKQIIEDGHAIGNHTFNHLNGWKTPTSDYLKNTLECQDLIDSKSKLFRPPYGKIRRSQISVLLEENFKIIMWTVLSKDYDQSISKETCLYKVLKHTRPGQILLFHDSIKAFKNMSYTLPQVLKEFSERGYKFDKIEF